MFLRMQMCMCAPKLQPCEKVHAYTCGVLCQHAHLCLYMYICVNYMASILSEINNKVNLAQQGNFLLQKGYTKPSR